MNEQENEQTSKAKIACPLVPEGEIENHYNIPKKAVDMIANLLHIHMYDIPYSTDTVLHQTLSRCKAEVLFRDLMKMVEPSIRADERSQLAAQAPEEAKRVPGNHGFDCSVCDVESDCMGCGTSAYEEGWKSAIEKVAPIYQAKIETERERVLQEVSPVVDKLFEAFSFADFSNGVGAFGMDEGRVRGYELIKSLEEQWQALKSGKQEAKS